MTSDSSEQQETLTPRVQAIVSQRPRYELLLRERGTSYAVAPQWSIAWVENGWRVFYRGIDAYFRLTHAEDCAGMVYSTFERAWQWLHELTEDEILKITSTSG